MYNVPSKIAWQRGAEFLEILGGRDFNFADLLPLTHAVTALNKVFTLGVGLNEIRFELTALILLLLLYFGLRVWLFRRLH